LTTDHITSHHRINPHCIASIVTSHFIPLYTGFSCLEIYKLLQSKPVTSYFNTFTNLAVCLFTSMEPQPPTTTTSVVKGKEWKWTQVRERERLTGIRVTGKD
jgi:hypothetical protein